MNESINKYSNKSESTTIEFKSFSAKYYNNRKTIDESSKEDFNFHYTNVNPLDDFKIHLIKAMIGFSNSEGGVLVIGVDDYGNYDGVVHEKIFEFLDDPSKVNSFLKDFITPFESIKFNYLPHRKAKEKIYEISIKKNRSEVITKVKKEFSTQYGHKKKAKILKDDNYTYYRSGTNTERITINNLKLYSRSKNGIYDDSLENYKISEEDYTLNEIAKTFFRLLIDADYINKNLRYSTRSKIIQTYNDHFKYKNQLAILANINKMIKSPNKNVYYELKNSLRNIWQNNVLVDELEEIYISDDSWNHFAFFGKFNDTLQKKFLSKIITKDKIRLKYSNIFDTALIFYIFKDINKDTVEIENINEYNMITDSNNLEIQASINLKIIDEIIDYESNIFNIYDWFTEDNVLNKWLQNKVVDNLHSVRWYKTELLTPYIILSDPQFYSDITNSSNIDEYLVLINKLKKNYEDSHELVIRSFLVFISYLDIDNEKFEIKTFSSNPSLTSSLNSKLSDYYLSVSKKRSYFYKNIVVPLNKLLDSIKFEDENLTNIYRNILFNKLRLIIRKLSFSLFYISKEFLSLDNYYEEISRLFIWEIIESRIYEDNSESVNIGDLSFKSSTTKYKKTFKEVVDGLYFKDEVYIEAIMKFLNSERHNLIDNSSISININKGYYTRDLGKAAITSEEFDTFLENIKVTWININEIINNSEIKSNIEEIQNFLKTGIESKEK